MESSASPINLSSTLSPAMLNTPQMEDMTTNQHVGYSVELDCTQQTVGKYDIVTTPTTTQHNLNTVVGLHMKMTLHTTQPQPQRQHKTTSTL